MEGEKLICDCPNHQDKRLHGFWPTSGEVDIPTCANRCPYCSFQSATKRSKATKIREHIKRAHLSENGTGIRLPNLTLIVRRPGRHICYVPNVGAAYGRSIESPSAFTPPAYTEEPSHNQTTSDPVSASSDTTKLYETQEPKTENKDDLLHSDPVWNEPSQRN